MSGLHGGLLHNLAALLPEMVNVQRTGRSRDLFPILALKFFININLLAAMWSLGRQPLTEINTRNITVVVNAANTWGSQTCHLHVLIV